MRDVEDLFLKHKISQEVLQGLSTPDVVFLFDVIARSHNPQITKSTVLKALEYEADERIGLAYDKNWQVPLQEAKALIRYANIAPQLLNLENGEERLLYTDAVHNLHSKYNLRDNQVLIFGTIPENEDVPANKVRSKEYGKHLMRYLKMNAPANKIIPKRTDGDTDDFIRYDLYAWDKKKDDKPTGTLIFTMENKMTLVSQDSQHCNALVQILKQMGKEEILLRKLDDNPEVAKKFAADMVAAAWKHKIRINHAYPLEELAKYNPEAAKYAMPHYKKTQNIH